MKNLLASLVLAICLFSNNSLIAFQNPVTPTFPSAVVTDNELLLASNRAQSKLSTGVNNTTLTIPVLNATSFRTPTTVTIDDEIMKICSKSGNNLTVCSGGRGFDGTVAAAHDGGKNVSATVTANFINAISSNLKSGLNYLKSYLKTPEMAGAVGDGTADDTVAVQAAITALNAFDVLDGRGKTYKVSTLNLKSNITLQNFNFVKSTGTAQNTPVLNIDGRVASPYSGTAKTNIKLNNIKILGNRAGETGITLGAAEDGGRHAIHIVGSVSKIVLNNVSATYSAGDGLLLDAYNDVLSDVETALPVVDIFVLNSDFSYNRRNGVTIEGASKVKFYNTSFTNNGTTLAGEATNTNGNFCATSGGVCYGTGLYLKADTNVLGTNFSNIVVDSSYFSGNYVRSIYAYSTEIPTLAGFIPKSKFIVSKSYLDKGTVNVSGVDVAVAFAYAGAGDGTGAVYNDISFTGNNIRGTFALRGVPRSTLHLRSGLLLESLEPSQVQESSRGLVAEKHDPATFDHSSITDPKRLPGRGVGQRRRSLAISP